MTEDALLNGIIDREGGDVITTDPVDRGMRTRFGISERAHPEAWVQGPPTRDAAKAIYTTYYVAPFAALPVADPVRVALIDDAVMSGVGTAIRSLQMVLGVVPDGRIGPTTIAAVGRLDGRALLVKLIQQRAHRLARIVERQHDQARFLVGWIDRTLSLLT